MLKTFGFEVYKKYYKPNGDGMHFIQINIWKSFDFETLARFFNALLLAYYRAGAERDSTSKLGYINNSLFLKQYGKI